ncbi:methyl-accepting chemotaxis protein [Stigmatella aurantiaca]|uniref:Methyl-accepting chemotaxis protein n=1 Tax=Stigmatella aurantiaca (strain DW4/3-1) TaxID=378806 RepID=Q09AR4_STIAD|nr:methyl-accepting chemotaxis protein [Stigmatella aurantiaca]ADO74856.1 Methyl-accepting chemotaxis protein [Stigmatella aurantiaca DW4/3-1]EAU68806.1 methyl-accepting chemotaxis sensory transducer [Stigmatella aurantiaca DW4/3-1]
MTLPLLGTLKLRGRLTLYTTLLYVVPLAALGWLQFTDSRERGKLQVQDTLTLEASGLRDLVEAMLAERESNVRHWAEAPSLRAALQGGAPSEAAPELAAVLRHSPTFRGLVLFNLEGRAVAASPPGLLEAYMGRQDEVLASPWFRAALEDRMTDKGLTLQASSVFRKRVLPLAAPVDSPPEGEHPGQHRGVLMAAYDWDHLARVVTPTLERARHRSHLSFALSVRRADGTVLFEARGAPLGQGGAPLTVVVENDRRIRDVGDGWRFVAQVDPEEAYADGSRALLVNFGLTALAVVLAAMGTFLVARIVTRPLVALSGMVGRVIHDRDLSQPLPVQASKDEVGQLASAFALMLGHLRDTTASLQNGMRVLNNTVSELNQASRHQERNIARQAAALQQTQVTAQEIKQTSLLAAEKADTVLSVASRAEDVGRSGEAAITSSLGGFEGLQEQVAQMAQSIARLNERTQQIGGITQTVKDLADQSNMLALNAAIEAVRSGEHGKGFGVVAREIRSLADQSIQATERVRDILGDISQAILSTAKMTEQGYTRMEEGLGQVRASGENLRELSTIVHDNAAAVRQIAAAVSQQNAGISQIFGAVTDLSTMMNETVTSLHSTSNAARTLQEVAEQMEHVARSYRV